MYNSLDALCKRFKISLAEREKHGALIDAQLLAEVYLELQGGREAGSTWRRRRPWRRPDGRPRRTTARVRGRSPRGSPRPRPQAHAAFVAGELKNALWLRLDP